MICGLDQTFPDAAATLAQLPGATGAINLPQPSTPFTDEPKLQHSFQPVPCKWWQTEGWGTPSAGPGQSVAMVITKMCVANYLLFAGGAAALIVGYLIIGRRK